MNAAARPHADTFWDTANLLSLSRIALAAVVWLGAGEPWFLFTVVATAAITDGLDGWVGRRTHAGRTTGTANVGAWLDPLCDKLFVTSTAIAVVVTYEVSPLVLALLLVRDVGVTILIVLLRFVGGRERFHAHDFRARIFGKVTMVAQLLTLLCVVVLPVAVFPLAVCTGALGVAAIAERVVLALPALRRLPAV